MDTVLCQFIDIVAKKLGTWEEGDPCSAMIHVCPHQERIRVHVSWDNFKFDICPTALSQHKIVKTHHQYPIVKGLKTIAETSGFGKISINPRRKAQAKNGTIEFEVVWIITFHTKAEVIPV